MLGWTIQKDVPNVVDMNLKGMIRPKVSPSKARHMSFTGRRMMQVQAQSWTSVISDLLSSIISGFGGSSELLMSEEPEGERDCSNKIYDYYKIETRVLSNGTVFQDTNIVGRSEMKCVVWITYPPQNYSFSKEIINQPLNGHMEIKCRGFSLSVCKPRTLTCSDEGYSCN